MKVCELIEQLSRLDPEAEVVCYNSDDTGSSIHAVGEPKEVYKGNLLISSKDGAVIQDDMSFFVYKTNPYVTLRGKAKKNMVLL